MSPSDPLSQILQHVRDDQLVANQIGRIEKIEEAVIQYDAC
jgi:hypothetical protein